MIRRRGNRLQGYNMENLTEKNLTDIFGNKFLSPKNYSALTLAYIGDCVYELYVRGYLIQKSDQKVNLLHKTSTRFVCAKAQAELYHRIKDMLSEDETAVFHRGRNTKSHVPKNAVVSDYRIATGIEALFGYLYITGKKDRISELLQQLFI